MLFYGKGLRDAAARDFLQEAITRLQGIFRGVFAGDNVVLLERNLGWRRNPLFMAAFRQHARSPQEQSLELRLNTLAWAADHALHVPGDFVECGVFRGFSSAVICSYLEFAQIPRQFWLYDTFAGIPKTSTPRIIPRAPSRTCTKTWCLDFALTPTSESFPALYPIPSPAARRSTSHTFTSTSIPPSPRSRRWMRCSSEYRRAVSSYSMTMAGHGTQPSKSPKTLGWHSATIGSSSYPPARACSSSTNALGAEWLPPPRQEQRR